MRPNALRLLTIVGATALLGACSTLPSSGPTAQQVTSGTGDAAVPAGYVFLDLTPQVVGVISKYGTPGLGGAGLPGRGGGPVTLGVGDTVNVTIFEASGESALFGRGGTAGGGSSVGIPTQQIDASGNISVPYAGQVRAAGRTVAEVQAEIEGKLKNRAIEPQVVISLQDRRSSLLTVVGDVNQPTRIPVDLGGVRVLDAVAQAGGSRFPAYETEVVLQRRGRRASVSLARLMNQPSENVTLAPGDTLQLMRRQRFYLALGASGRSARIEYDADRLSLADGIAKAGGLLDDRADPAGVFVYRFERKPILRDLGLAADRSPELVPTIYKLNLRDPGGLFVAEGFTLRPNDIIYVSNAPTVDFLKFITVVRGITGVARDLAGTARDVDLVIKSSQGGSNNGGNRGPTIIEQ